MTYLVIVCKDGIELFRGQLDTLQTKGSVGTNVIWRKKTSWVHLIVNVQFQHIAALENKYFIHILYYYCCCFVFPAPFGFPTWNLSKKFSCTGRSLWERRTLLLDTEVVNYSDPGTRERTSAGSAFQHLSREQKKEGSAYYLAISDRPSFPSPFRSNIRSYKVKAEYR